MSEHQTALELLAQEHRRVLHQSVRQAAARVHKGMTARGTNVRIQVFKGSADKLVVKVEPAHLMISVKRAIAREMRRQP